MLDVFITNRTPDPDPDGTFPSIKYAAGFGQLEALEFLVDRCPVMQPRHWALCLALYYGHIECVLWLIEIDAGVNESTSPSIYESCTHPLHYALAAPRHVPASLLLLPKRPMKWLWSLFKLFWKLHLSLIRPVTLKLTMEGFGRKTFIEANILSCAAFYGRH